MQKYVNLVDLLKSFPSNMLLQKLLSIQPRAVQHSLVPTCHAPPGSSIPLWLQGSGVSEGKRRHEANKKRSSHVRASMLARLVARLALAFVKCTKLNVAVIFLSLKIAVPNYDLVNRPPSFQAESNKIGGDSCRRTPQ